MTNETFNYCQYLYVASQNLLRAVTYFNSNVTGDVERSFSALHKSWVLLFQADILMNHNGSIHYCKNDLICLDSNHNRLFYGIERALNEVGNKGSSINPQLSNGYVFAKGTGLFKTLNEKKNFYQNLSIIRDVRNVDQHDYFEANPEIFTDFMDVMRPYVISNIKNFMETYDAFLMSRENCSSRKDKSRCSCIRILSSEQLSSQIYFPISYNYIFTPNKANATSLSVKNRQSKIDDYKNQLAEKEKFLGSKARKVYNLTKEAEKSTTSNANVEIQLELAKDDLAKTEDTVNKLKFRLIHLEDDEYLSEAGFNFRHSTIRKRFEESAKIYGKSIEDDGRLLINVSADQEALENESGRSQLLGYIQDHLKTFRYNKISEVKLALDNAPDFLYDISISRIKAYWDEIELHSENINEEYFGIYFGELRYTQKFVEYIKKKYNGPLKPAT